MKVDELLKILNLRADQVKITVEPEHSLSKLNEFEKCYGIPSSLVYWVVKQGFENEFFEEWAHYYIRFIEFGGNIEDLYFNKCFAEIKEGQPFLEMQKPEQELSAVQVF
ncbi:hypothetical protein BBF96_00995 [Anoxybacter fermentans]|uniref:Uncharacterized protein n=1 Tax=Anoxybacter fermentans TaxID=1323375 RepID=A0A3Q9HNI6_9FIRM|nr:hypothetical protein [Anoxybacter fermentans]AZR72090.1 hypothetical protein BBF96_00995 [Anoxybacter fermentans]